MVSKYEISCIVTSADASGQVTHIAGINEFGNQWKLPVARAIIGIEQRDWDFYISHNGQQFCVVVSQEPSGEKSIRIAGQEDTGLWQLPHCTF